MALSIADAEARIEAINAILAAGVRSVQSASGRRVEYDLEALRRERDHLQASVTRATTGGRSRGVYHA